MSEDDRKPGGSDEPRESDSKGAVEEDTRKISAIDPDDPLGNERASEEHSGQTGKRKEE